MKDYRPTQDSSFDRDLAFDEETAELPVYRAAPGRFPLTRDINPYIAQARKRAAAAGISKPTLPWGHMPAGSGALLGAIFRKESGGQVSKDVAVDRLQKAQTSTGEPLPSGLREQLERALRADLSRVRIHRGGDSAAAAEAIGARAYTTGQDIHFAAGQFDPSSAAGRELIAHEVAHTVQQLGVSMTSSPTLRLSQAGDRHELEADRFAERFAQAPSEAAQLRIEPGVAPQAVVHRKGDPVAEAIGTDEAKAKDALAKARGAGQGGRIEAIIRSNFDKETADKIIAEAPAAKAAPKVDGADKAKADAGANKGKGDSGKGGDAGGKGDGGKAAGPKGGGGDAKGGSAKGPASAVPSQADLDALSPADLGLIHQELIEHEMWQKAADIVGDISTPEGQAKRASFIASNVAEGAITGFATGFVMGAGAAVVGKLAARFVPIPGVGSMIAGGMAAYGLVTKDWGAAWDTVGKIGKGEGMYDTLANTIAGISEILSTLCDIANVIAGLIGLISAIMWIVSIVTVGAASPLAATLSSIALGITAVTGAIGVINDSILAPLVLVFRMLHTYTSDADPREVQKQGAGLKDAASKVGGALGGAAGGGAVNKGMAGAARVKHKVGKSRAAKAKAKGGSAKGKPAKTKGKRKPPKSRKKSGKSGSASKKRTKKSSGKKKGSGKSKKQSAKDKAKKQAAEANADNQSRWDRYKKNSKKAWDDYKKRLDDLKKQDKQYQEDLDDPAGARARKQKELDDALADSKKKVDDAEAAKHKDVDEKVKALKDASEKSIKKKYSDKVKQAAKTRDDFKKKARKDLDDEWNGFEQKHRDKQAAIDTEKKMLKEAHTDMMERVQQIEDPGERAAQKKYWDDRLKTETERCNKEQAANEKAYATERETKLADIRERREAAKKKADADFDEARNNAKTERDKAMEEHNELSRQWDEAADDYKKAESEKAGEKRDKLDEQHKEKSETEPDKAEWESQGTWYGGKRTDSPASPGETKSGWLKRRYYDKYVKPWKDISGKSEAHQPKDPLGNLPEGYDKWKLRGDPSSSTARTDEGAGGAGKALSPVKKSVDSGLKSAMGITKSEEDKEKDKKLKAETDAAAKEEGLSWYEFHDKSVLAHEKKEEAHRAQFAPDSQMELEAGRERPNPNYQPPPCTPGDLEAIKEGILTNLEKRAEAEKKQKDMAGAKDKAGKDVEGFTGMEKEADTAMSAQDAHAQATAAKDKANQDQQGREKEATGMISKANKKKAAFKTLKPPLKAVGGFKWVGEKVDSDSLIKIGSDSQNLLKAINTAEAAMEKEEATTDAREQAHQKQAGDIAKVKSEGEATKATSEANKTAIGQHKQGSQGEKEAATAAESEAGNDAAARGAEADKGKSKHKSMAQQLLAWATAHKAARLSAMEKAGLIEVQEPAAEGVNGEPEAQPDPEAGAPDPAAAPQPEGNDAASETPTQTQGQQPPEQQSTEPQTSQPPQQDQEPNQSTPDAAPGGNDAPVCELPPDQQVSEAPPSN